MVYENLNLPIKAEEDPSKYDDVEVCTAIEGAVHDDSAAFPYDHECWAPGIEPEGGEVQARSPGLSKRELTAIQFASALLVQADPMPEIIPTAVRMADDLLKYLATSPPPEKSSPPRQPASKTDSGVQIEISSLPDWGNLEKLIGRLTTIAGSASVDPEGIEEQIPRVPCQHPHAVKVEWRLWPDSHYGLKKLGEVYSPVITPGWEITVLDSRGRAKTWRTNHDGSNMRLVNA